MSTFDLLSLVEYGGCSAKLDPGKLSELLSDLPLLKNSNVLVDINTHDDAGVYRINQETALIVTTDFFPPICSDPKLFGEIAATNSLSDVYAMGGAPLLTLNLTMFPSQTLPLEVLHEILLGGQTKVNEAGAFTMGGHTIEDPVPKYGLAVVGVVHPDALITNAGLRPGQKLILTKPLGTGVLVAAERMKLAARKGYQQALESMCTLNKTAMEVMQRFGVRGATDITGFGLLGHALGMARASGVSLQFDSGAFPVFDEVEGLLENGCIPGAAFRNLNFVKDELHTAASCPVSYKMLACDAQTSGGLLMGVDESVADEALLVLRAAGLEAALVGEVLPSRDKMLYLF